MLLGSSGTAQVVGALLLALGAYLVAPSTRPGGARRWWWAVSASAVLLAVLGAIDWRPGAVPAGTAAATRFLVLGAAAISLVHALAGTTAELGLERATAWRIVLWPVTVVAAAWAILGACVVGTLSAPVGRLTEGWFLPVGDGRVRPSGWAYTAWAVCSVAALVAQLWCWFEFGRTRREVRVRPTAQ